MNFNESMNDVKWLRGYQLLKLLLSNHRNSKKHFGTGSWSRNMLYQTFLLTCLALLIFKWFMLCTCYVAFSVVIVYSSLQHHTCPPSYTFPIIIICFSYHLFPFWCSISYIVLFKWVRLCLYSACVIRTFHDFHEYHEYIDISSNFIA